MKRVCLHCRKRWRQHGTLCRTCARKTGILQAVVPQLERDRLAVAKLLAKREAVTPAPTIQRPPVTRTIDGIDYEVTFDGAVR